VIHGGADIPHNVPVLADRTKNPTHDDLPSASRRHIISRPLFFRSWRSTDRPAAIDDEFGTGDIAAFVAGNARDIEAWKKVASDAKIEIK
jgi:hypothetical protein